jgi:hypothetical protein
MSAKAKASKIFATMGEESDESDEQELDARNSGRVSLSASILASRTTSIIARAFNQVGIGTCRL